MGNKFLDKVLDQLVYETRIDYDMGEIQFPFSSLKLFLFKPSSSHLSPEHFQYIFSDHCEDIYGLNEEETDYVWEEYIKIIKDKISQ